MNAVKSNDSESEAAFLMSYNMDSVESNDFGDGDWFDEVAKVDSRERDWFSDVEEDECISSVSDNDSPKNFPFPDTSDVVLVAAELASPEGDCSTYA